jgi:hypothetical protein
LRKIKIFTILLFILFIASGISLVYVVNELDPDASTVNPYLFYGAAFLTGFFLTTLLGFWARRYFGQRELLQKHFYISLRQGVWFGVLVVVALILQSFRLFTWINSLLLILALLFLEFYFLALEKKSQQN